MTRKKKSTQILEPIISTISNEQFKKMKIKRAEQLHKALQPREKTPDPDFVKEFNDYRQIHYGWPIPMNKENKEEEVVVNQNQN